MTRALAVLRAVGCGCAVVWALVPTAYPQSTPPREWKLSTALGPVYPQGKAGEVWARLIEERSGGRLAVKHFPGAMLVQRDPAREFAGLRDGTIDLAVGSATNWAAQVKELNLIALPWLFPDRLALERTLASDVGVRLSTAIEAAGVVPLATAADAFQQLATRHGVHAPSDLTGVKLRSPRPLLFIDSLLALGALPVGLSSSDARSALSRGALDGEVLGVAAFGAARLYVSGAPHLLVWDAFADALFFAVNREDWAALSAADRDLVRVAARDAALEASALARDQAGDVALARLARDGTTVTRLTHAGKEAFRVQTQAVYDRWSAVAGEGLVRAAEAVAGGRGPAPQPR
jgi:TRAP-type C4-dicarboxylate transport system substrate-binding protein